MSALAVGARRALTVASNVHLARRHPVSLVHFVTRRCNARCSFCFVDFDHPTPRRLEMTLDEIDQMTRTVGPSLLNVNLTGGEPFLRGDLTEIAAAYYRNAGVRSVYVTSNGAFPDRVERFARDLTAAFPERALTVSLSIDGFPEEHDRIRKVPGLFDNALGTYAAVRDIGQGVMANIAITVSHENHDAVPDLYRSLVERHGVRSITAVLVRDEGVHTVPESHKAAVVDAYRWLTERIGSDLRDGRLDGYAQASLQGRLMNRKNEILWNILADTYLDPRFVSTCYSASLFGVIDNDASVHPCEILDRPLGNLRDHDLDFGAVWQSEAARSTSKWIAESKCHCSYECAWGFNILANARYQPALIAAALHR